MSAANTTGSRWPHPALFVWSFGVLAFVSCGRDREQPPGGDVRPSGFSAFVDMPGHLERCTAVMPEPDSNPAYCQRDAYEAHGYWDNGGVTLCLAGRAHENPGATAEGAGAPRGANPQPAYINFQNSVPFSIQVRPSRRGRARHRARSARMVHSGSWLSCRKALCGGRSARHGPPHGLAADGRRKHPHAGFRTSRIGQKRRKSCVVRSDRHDPRQRGTGGTQEETRIVETRKVHWAGILGCLAALGMIGAGIYLLTSEIASNESMVLDALFPEFE